MESEDRFADGPAGLDQVSRRLFVKQALTEAEDRGYQRGKAEQVVLRSQSQHGFLSSTTDMKAQVQTDRCVCGAVFSCDMFEVNEALNDHVRQAWADQSVPCEWGDLEGLEGRALRERLGSRAHVYGMMIRHMEAFELPYPVYEKDRVDRHLLIDLIQSKSQACDVEAARLWEAHLHELTTWYIEEDPSYVVLLERAGNVQYAQVVVERAASRKLQEVS